MPELPDVEVYRQFINTAALYQRINHIHVEDASILFETSPQGLGHALKHKSFHSTERHGKYLFISLDNKKWLVLHFGMTGRLHYFKNPHDTPDYTRLLIFFENGYHLSYIASRKLGRIALTNSPQKWINERKLGPDAMNLNEEAFIELAAKRRGGVKSWLMNQKSIAGIGNVYSDEILFQAKIHPRRLVKELDKTACRRLFNAMRYVLKTSIRARADSRRMPSAFLLPYRNQDGLCPICDTPLESVKAAGRTSWYCPRCQKK